MFLKILTGLFILSSVFLLTRFYFVHLESVPKPGGTYVEGLIGQPRFINPVLSSSQETDNDIAHLVFSGLLKYDNQQNLVTEIASDYFASEDHLSYTFVIKNDAKWHDGKDLTSKDVAFTVNLIKDPIVKSPLASSFKNVQTEIVDEKTIKFNLEEPYAPFLSIMTFGILPEHVWSKITNNQFHLAEYNIKPIGNGPFVFKSLTKDKLGFIKTYTLERNENYFDKPYLEKVVFNFFNDSQEAVNALRNNNIDGLVYNLTDWEDKITKANKRIGHYPLYLPQYTALFLNQINNFELKNEKIRQALRLSINKDQILQNALGGNGEVIAGPISKGMIGYHEGLEKNSPNKDKARELLDEAGWKITDGQEFRTKGEEKLKIVLTTLDQMNYVKVANEVKDSWQKIGIKVEIETVPASFFQSEIIRPKNYQVLLYGVITGGDPDPYPIWHSSQKEFTGLNLSLFEDKDADNLLTTARVTNDYQERDKSYREFQEIVHQKIPAIFLYNPNYNYFINRQIKGVDLGRISIPQDRFSDITSWYIKTSKALPKK